MFANRQKPDLLREQRRSLVEQLRHRGISDENVLTAINQLRREDFVQGNLSGRAYDDNALPINCGQTISQPYTVAFMTEQLKVFKGCKALEIGTGSGYQSALLYMLGAKVYTVERIYELFESSKKLFSALEMRILTKFGDGTIGWLEYQPFDRIIVTAAAPSVPKALSEQLAVGGIMVIPIGDRDAQAMYVIKRLDENNFNTKVHDRFKFVPLIGVEGWSD